MYLEHFGFTKAPFSSTPDPHFYFPFSSHDEGMKILDYSLSNQDLIVKITGGVGLGKSSLIEHFTAFHEPHHCCVIQNPNIHMSHMIDDIIRQLPIPKGTQSANSMLTSSYLALETRLKYYHQHIKPVVLIIDEAQTMSPEILEALRLLTNLKVSSQPLIKIVLFGQPELDNLLSDTRLSQIRQRISFSHQLKSLTFSETVKYINHRINNAGSMANITWEQQAYQSLFNITDGVPRLISIIADKALLLAQFERTHLITRAHINKAAKYTEFTHKRLWGLHRIHIYALIAMIAMLPLLIYRHLGFAHVHI